MEFDIVMLGGILVQRVVVVNVEGIGRRATERLGR